MSEERNSLGYTEAEMEQIRRDNRRAELKEQWGWLLPVGLIILAIFLVGKGLIYLSDQHYKAYQAQQAAEQAKRDAEYEKWKKEHPNAGGGCDPQSVSPCGQPDTNFTPPSAPSNP
jgi:hypothetical protein